MTELSTLQRPAPSLSARRELSILLVEDSARDAQLIAARLSSDGLEYDLKRVQTHDDFINALAERQFDVILSDYNVPGFEGTGALAAARLACPETPFIFVSGALGEERAIELLKRGATDYVLKDRLERLVPGVERALREAHERQERRRAEEERQKTEERLRLALDSARLGIWDVDPRTGRCEWDAAAKAMLGLASDAELTLKQALSAVHPDDAARVRQALLVTLDPDSGGRYHQQLRIIGLGDGVERWLSVHGQAFFDDEGAPVRVVGTVRDISTEKLGEQERAQLAAVVEESTDFIAIARLDGSIFFLNRAGQQLVGLNGEAQVRATHFTHFFAPQSLEEAHRVLKQALEDGPRGAELRFRHFSTGEEIPVYWNVFPIKSAHSGQPVAFATVTRDLREQKRHEAELERRAIFEQQLIGIVSHDLRNPLNAIAISAAMLIRQEGLDERSSKGVRRILSSAERATRMIRDLLDFTQARLGGGIPVMKKALDLDLVAQQVLDELQHTHPERELVLQKEGDTRGEWDPDRIAQVLSNLVDNALKYSPNGSPVTVRLSGSDDEVRLEVHNLGEPIPPEKLPRLFKPLSRGDVKQDLQSRSIGLGLYIVESIARAHAGRVEASSSREDGTRLAVCLPRRMGR